MYLEREKKGEDVYANFNISIGIHECIYSNNSFIFMYSENQND